MSRMIFSPISFSSIMLLSPSPTFTAHLISFFSSSLISFLSLLYLVTLYAIFCLGYVSAAPSISSMDNFHPEPCAADADDGDDDDDELCVADDELCGA